MSNISSECWASVVAVLVTMVLASACDENRCVRNSNCALGESCQAGVCRVIDAGPDAGGGDAAVAMDDGGPSVPDGGEVPPGDVDAGDVDAGDVDAGDVDAGDVDAGDVDAGT